jgi:hypothetical protein
VLGVAQDPVQLNGQSYEQQARESGSARAGRDKEVMPRACVISAQLASQRI